MSRRWGRCLLWGAVRALTGAGSLYADARGLAELWTGPPGGAGPPAAGPPPGHPERLRPDLPLTPLERSLRRQLRDPGLYP